jgi:hypothetical protein
MATPGRGPEEIHKDLVNTIVAASLAGVWSLPTDSVEVFAEACLAAKAGAHNAAAMMCRASIEAAGWQALYLRAVAPGVWVEESVPRLPNGERVRLSLALIIEGLEHHGVLSGARASEADNVRKRGDTVAHIVESTARKWEKERPKILAELAKSGKLAPLPRFLQGVSDVEAIEILESTATVLAEIFRGVQGRTGPTPYLLPPAPSTADR